ncbi:unnamed protein product [Musa acuminata subsp. burmannicoides]
MVVVVVVVIIQVLVFLVSAVNSWLSSHAASPVPGAHENFNPQNPDIVNQNENLQRKPLCDTSDRRADICDMEGDIRIHANSSSIFFITSSNRNTTELQESWRVKPHPRKGDLAALSRVTEMSVGYLSNNEDVPKCDIKSSVPAIIFATGGYMGNFFHETTDLIIPLYITSHKFNGEVQFLISDMLPWWITKYELLLKKLSHYEIIDFNRDPLVRCYPRVIVGITFHRDMSIDPARSGGVTMFDFGQFIRSTYSLKKERAIKLGANQDKKPRLLIISRKRTRKFTNVDEIARMAEWEGFEPVVSEIKENQSLVEFAHTVNSCDAMLGVHGAGLTNLIFLPTNAVVIQVVPLGGLETFCWADYGVPTLEMKMRYLQYSISITESSLVGRYVDQQPSEAYGVGADEEVEEQMLSLQKPEREKKTEDALETSAEERVHDDSSSTITHATAKEEPTETNKPNEVLIAAERSDGERIQMMKPPAEPICDFSNPRTEFCEMKGDVRIHGKPSSVVFVSPQQQSNEWKIMPYVRKQMENIEKVSVRTASSPEGVPSCTINQTVPAIVFTLGGFIGNYYHDFTDILLPLFMTARQFDGEVQFLVTNIQMWWFGKYQQIIKRLTRYEFVDLDNSDEVLCHPHVMVGLRFHNDLMIDPARAPNGYSMTDFTKFVRSAYSLEREYAISLREQPDRKPKLLLVTRKGSRRFTNVPEIVAMAKGLNYEVVDADASFGDVAGFVGMVNSCDVIMGVHGAGLTNFVFLPMNAVLVQIVPCCELEPMATHTFGFPSMAARLHYLEYNITVDESTLLQLYPRDHAVFTDPQSIHKLGWMDMGKIYLRKQDVKLDVNRFRPVLQKAMDLLRR